MRTRNHVAGRYALVVEAEQRPIERPPMASPSPWCTVGGPVKRLGISDCRGSDRSGRARHGRGAPVLVPEGREQHGQFGVDLKLRLPRQRQVQAAQPGVLVIGPPGDEAREQPDDVEISLEVTEASAELR